MTTDEAFEIGRRSHGKRIMTFDWIKAAKIIKETGATEASAGLRGDWGYTGGQIFVDGKPCGPFPS